MPGRPCILRRLHHLGSSRAQADVWVARGLRCPQLVLHSRLRGPFPCLVHSQDVPQQDLDSVDKPPSPSGRHSHDASSHTTQLQCMGIRRGDIQFLRVQIQEELVAKIQLCSFSGTGCWTSLHGCASLLHVEHGE